MSYLKNTASQRFNVLAINSATGSYVTGDAANITAKISIDSAAFASVADTNPTELDATNAPGVYVFDLSQAETNGDVLTIVPSSTTANVQMDMLNIYTVDPATYKADVTGLATAIALGVTDGKCTSILTDTGTSIPAQITALNDFDPASDTVANVTLVATTTTNTDMRGTDNAAAASSLSITNSSVNTIKAVTNNLPDSGALSSLATASDLATVDTVVDAILVDTGTTIPTQITGLNNLDAAGVRSAVGLASANLDTQIADLPTVAEFEARTLVAAAYFDPASDAVANVTLVATTTTNTDMRGTDGANTVAPANSDVAAIKAKTDQFVFTVSNQVDANALTGGGGDDAATIYTYFTAGTNENAFKADVTGLATSSSISALNDFDPSSDTVANVTLVGTTSTNTDMRGTDGANTTTPNTVAPDNAGVTAIKAKTDQMVFTIANQIDANALTSAGNAGTGANTVTLTVKQGATPLENAVIGAVEGVNDYIATTNASGQAVFNLDNASYTIAIYKSGYSFAGATLVVSGTTAATYLMSQITIPTSANPDTVTAYINLYDEAGAKASVACSAELYAPPTGTIGTGYVPNYQAGTTSVAGLFTCEVYKGATYKLVLNGVETYYVVPAAAADPYNLPSTLAGC